MLHTDRRTAGSSPDRGERADVGVTPRAADAVVLFDGMCNLCSRLVRFVAARDPRRRFRFAPLQSERARALLRARGLDPDDRGSLVVIEGETALRHSDAALRIAAGLSGPWRWMRVLRIVPRPLRDLVYRVVARTRYAVFGRRASCALPGVDFAGPDLERRFLDEG
jgi:predicted DCC family thiol-disulfide oxidoreductase YuxK